MSSKSVILSLSNSFDTFSKSIKIEEKDINVNNDLAENENH